ncbi:MAG TPA: hypothetical protein VMR81_07035 [Patescibacteria group bacterium]|nr:hypothetical protein [Patescibacteria group bacterium]
MKKWLLDHKFVLITFLVWRLVLFVVSLGASFIVPIRIGYLGLTPWSNMDGIHYIQIAQGEHFLYSEAFFPLYPFAIRYLHNFVRLSYENAGIAISIISFFVGAALLYDLLKEQSENIAKWAILFLFTFPTAFFFTSVYTEGLFFLLAISTVVLAKKKNFLLAGFFGGLAGAARLVGVFLLIPVLWEYIQMKQRKIKVSDIVGFLCVPLGLVLYMAYLYHTTGDPLRFFHVQSEFGANRSGNEIILLPQVIWRYFKIIFSAVGQPTLESYSISIAEFVFTMTAYILLYYGWRIREELSYIVYAFVVLTLPTLTGTFSSIPRYILVIFPLFIILGKIPHKSIKITLIIIFSLLQIAGTMLYLRGWFVA